MQTINEIKDDIAAGRLTLVAALNELHEVDPESAYWSYLASLQEIQNHFKGAKPDELAEDVEEKGDIS